jgi:hypothetical protein
VIQPILPLHECAVEPLQDVVESVASPKAAEATNDCAAAESAVEHLHYAADTAGFGAALTKAFCLCVRFLILSIT